MEELHNVKLILEKLRKEKEAQVLAAYNSDNSYLNYLIGVSHGLSESIQIIENYLKEVDAYADSEI